MPQEKDRRILLKMRIVRNRKYKDCVVKNFAVEYVLKKFGTPNGEESE